VEENQQNIYLIHIRFGGDQPLIERISESVTLIKAALSKISENNFKLAYSSKGSDTIGFLVKTRLDAGPVLGQLQNPGKSEWYMSRKEIDAAQNAPPTPSPLRAGDTVMVFKIGDDFSENGFGVVRSWLEHQ